MQPLMLCVPNISEGRREDVINTIVAAIRRAGAVYMLDVSSDYDHNRTVLTFAGRPEEVEKSAFATVKAATEHINLDEHDGVHPRLGATDVVPFVPMRGIKMATCVAVAQRLGQRVGDELQLPVYLYERAATRSDRENLANIRSLKFQYEQLKLSIQNDPTYLPDFGPATLGPAGGVCIGARAPLIAFNVFLNTDDVTIAQRIAETIRASNGGLAYVKAAGFLVDGRAQVSMNLTDYRKTPLPQVVEMIRREAQRYGVLPAFSELIGLAPQDAFVRASRWYLQLDGFAPDQLLEQRIAQAEAEAAASPIVAEEPPVPQDATELMPSLPAFDQASRPSAFLQALAEPKATPGGGGVAALAGGLAAALAQMVAGLTVDKPRYAEVRDEMQDVLARAEELRGRLLDNVVRDAEAFNALMNTVKLPESDPDRIDLLVERTYEVSIIPLTVCQQALEAMELAAIVAQSGNRSATADAIVGIHMAAAALESAAVTMRVNLIGFEEQDRAATMIDQMERILEAGRRLRDKMLAQAYERAGL
jgi:glutamate formiminotransferase / formiminotetrahydrofolate cyclodeaminase